ncbi:hypothetical protein P3G55_08720 [Leptospira sp. 96542]|nr:hypothetical protein [Leptospira sp. 96542]
MFQFPETNDLLVAYAKWRDTVDRTEGSETIFGANAEVSEISRDLREDAEFELRLLIQDLKKTKPGAIREWVETNRERLSDTNGLTPEFIQKRKSLRRDWKFSKSPFGISIRYPHPSQYWGSGLEILDPRDNEETNEKGFV